MTESSLIYQEDKISLQARVFERLREDILKGVYKEGEELREMTLGKQLGVSRTPVREALRQLELEGLVRIVQNKGAYVIGISSKDLKDIYEMRARLEGMCAAWAVKNGSEEETDRLEEIVDLAEFQCSKERYDKVLELDNDFHELLYQMADSKMLYRTMADFHHYLEELRKKTLSSKERVLHSVQEHRDIVEAIKKGEAGQAEKLAVLHIRKTIENIEEHNLW